MLYIRYKMFKLLAICIVIIFALGCDTGPLPQETAQEIVEETIDLEEYNEKCVFSMENFKLIFGKPEFIEFHMDTMCVPEVEIESIEYISDTAATVQYSIRYAPSRQIVNGILKGWEELEERYAGIEAELIPDHRYGYLYVYADPHDGEVFVQRPDDPEGLFETNQWERLTQIRDDIKSLADGDWRSEIFEIEMSQYNDTWRVQGSDPKINNNK